MTDEEKYEVYKSDPHAGNGNSESERLINHARERERRAMGYYGSDYERDKAEYLRRKEIDKGYAGN